MRNFTSAGVSGGLAAAGFAALACLLTGCGGGQSSAGSAAPAIARPGTGQGKSVMTALPAAGRAQRASTAGQLRLAGQDIVYTASMTVRVTSVSRAAARAAEIAGRAGGYVSGENADPRPGNEARPTANITLKIPVAVFSQVLSELSGELGTQTYLNQQAQDVTQQVADTASRVASARAAIAQLRALLRDAGSVGALLMVQDQINAQESALEALQAQQRALDHETTYATVSLELTGPVTVAVRHHRARPAGGFTGGLSTGWKALRGTVSWLLRALGAVLPIGGVVALATFLGYRGYRMLRRRTGPGPAASGGGT